MSYRDLRAFICQLESQHLLKRIAVPVDPRLEMTLICDRVLKNNGPALLFTQLTRHSIPVLANLFGTVERISLALGSKNLRELGQLLAALKHPEPPKNWQALLKQWPLLKNLFYLSPKIIDNPECQQVILENASVDLSQLPIQTCWPNDAAPLITFGLVVTQNPHSLRHNLGIYRQQLLDKNKLIIRWLSMRGGALDHQEWQKIYPEKPFPIAVALGTDPATTLAAVTPIPDNLSEYAFAGLLRNQKTMVATCLSHDLQVPATAEIILEGFIYPGEIAPEGPFGDHTGYYNEIESFPVMTVTRITHRENPIYHSTYTGRPPDEPAILGAALNEIFIPLLQKQFPEIIDFYLPPEGCSYRLAVVTIQKQTLGHAKRVMMGIWSFLKQFTYTKWIIVTDEDINARDWKDVIWAITTRVDPARDILILENTPIDTLDFASPIRGLGSKIGIDATHKWPGETNRVWGTPIIPDPVTQQKIEALWERLGI